MHQTDYDYAEAHIVSLLDNLYSHLEYYSTAHGGEPDEKTMGILQLEIDELNEALEKLQGEKQ